MKLKNSKIIFFAILLSCFGLGQVSEALNYSNGINIHTEINDLAKEGGEVRKVEARKVEVRKVEVRKVEAKKVRQEKCRKERRR